MSDKETRNIANLTVQFLTTHDYFSNVWKNLTFEQKNKVIEIIVCGKGVIQYEKIETIVSLSCKPEDGIFFLKDEIFSSLKDKAFDNECYKNVKQFIYNFKNERFV